MPVVNQDTKHISQLLTGPVPFIGSYESNFNFATVTIEAVGADLDIPAIGTPLVYDVVNANFVPYVAQDISAVTTSSLPDEAPVCITVGPATGIATDVANLEALTGATVDAIVLFRGPYTIKEDGMELTGISAPDIAEFKAQMEKQEVRVTDATVLVDPLYADYS